MNFETWFLSHHRWLYYSSLIFELLTLSHGVDIYKLKMFARSKAKTNIGSLWKMFMCGTFIWWVLLTFKKRMTKIYFSLSVCTSWTYISSQWTLILKSTRVILDVWRILQLIWYDNINNKVLCVELHPRVRAYRPYAVVFLDWTPSIEFMTRFVVKLDIIKTCCMTILNHGLKLYQSF